MDDAKKYSTKNQDDVDALQEIAETQKSKIFCLRKCKNQLMGKLNSDHEKEINHRDSVISTLKEEKKILCRKGTRRMKICNKTVADELEITSSKSENVVLKEKIEVVEKNLYNQEK